MIFCAFFPCDAVLARVLAMAVCLCLCMSVARIETDERIWRFFGVGAFFDLSYTVLEGNSGISKKIKVLRSGTFPLLWKILPQID